MRSFSILFSDVCVPKDIIGDFSLTPLPDTTGQFAPGLCIADVCEEEDLAKAESIARALMPTDGRK